MIDVRAVVDPSAKIGKDVTIGPYSVIGVDVEICDGTWIGPHVVIQGPAVIGKNNKIFQFASVGDEPQDLTYQGEPTRLEIGDHNIIREYCTISRGTVKGGGITRVGDHNFFMAFSHVGHDSTVGNHTIMINYSALSGHVHVDDYAIIGAYAAIHQFCRVGAYAFITRATYVTQDVLPYLMIAGQDASAIGLNAVGLKRRGFQSTTIDMLKRAYKIIFRKGLTVTEALIELEIMARECPEILPMIDILSQSTRGIAR